MKVVFSNWNHLKSILLIQNIDLNPNSQFMKLMHVSLNKCTSCILLILLFLNTTNAFADLKTNKAFNKLDRNGILSLMMQWQTLREFFLSFSVGKYLTLLFLWLLEILSSANYLSVVNMFNDI